MIKPFWQGKLEHNGDRVVVTKLLGIGFWHKNPLKLGGHLQYTFPVAWSTVQ